MAFIATHSGEVSKDLTLTSIEEIIDDKRVKIDFDDYCILKPGIYYMTYDGVPEIKKSQLGIIDGKSSLARLGVMVTKTSETLLQESSTPEPLFVRTLMPIKMYKDMAIAQILIDDSDISGHYENKGTIKIQGSSDNLTLNSKVYKYNLAQGEYLDSKGDNSKFLEELEIDSGGLLLEPLTLYLALTNEVVSVDGCVAKVITPGMKSPDDMQFTTYSIEHASLIKDGWVGRIALEINGYVGTSTIYPNMEIARLDSLGNTSKNSIKEESRYQGQETPAQRK